MIDALVMRFRRAGTERERESAVAAIKRWIRTDEGTLFLLSALCPPPPRKRFLRRPEEQQVLPVSRVVVPLSLAPLGEARSELLGASEETMSPRELAMVDGVSLGWAEWDPVRRSLTGDDCLAVVVPPDLTIGQAAMALLGATSAVWPEMMEVQE